jgi:hypothetical protein
MAAVTEGIIEGKFGQEPPWVHDEEWKRVPLEVQCQANHVPAMKSEESYHSDEAIDF